MIKDIILGAIAQKIGTSKIFTKEGYMIPVTFLKIQNNIVIDANKDKSLLASICCKSYKSKKNLNKLFANVQSCKKRKIKYFYQSFVNSVHIGVFIKGQIISINSKSKGKGYLGVIKRYDFSGLDNTHGVSLKHRSLGSTGQCQDPGKVFKNKKMSGRKNNKIFIKNIKIIDIDIVLKIFIVQGLVPGNNGSYLYINNK